MIIERSMHSGWLSNSYLVGDEEGGTGVLIDSGGPPAPLIAAAESHGLTITHLLITHADADHIDNNAEYVSHFSIPVAAHPIEADRMGGADILLADRETLTTGGLEITSLFTPGHSPGHLAFLINSTDCFTGDVLFHGTVGGTLHDSYAKIHSSLMDTLMGLPDETAVHPGHTDPTTIGEEREHNPFIRIWRGLEPPGEGRCTALDRPATLRLFGPDYDGGHKAWVTWDDSGEDDLVPGSRVVI